MKRTKGLIILLLMTFFWGKGFSQCVTLGQTPPTAFPVCGTTTFHQTTVPICSTNDLWVPGCTGDGALYANKNPFWYKFTCYQTGTLGFVITPNASDDDYDWQLYDVTGLDPNEVFTNQNIIVTGNWSGTYAPTGASAAGVNYLQCASDPTEHKPTFAQMPTIFVGHKYLLLISHFTDTQNGYSLSFGGGTAVITDPLDPHLLSAKAPCDGTEIRIVTNKKMKCNTLAADGSDFTVSDGTTTFIPTSASSIQCSNGFDMDTLSIFLATPLAPGNYTVKIKNGSDGNTLQDNCDKLIPVGESQTFTVYPLLPTPMDSVTKPGCAPQSVTLVFKKGILCSSIDPAGGDFNITGPYPVTIASAAGNCAGGKADHITLNFSAPLLVNGNFTIHLQTGPDGNTLIDECAVETPLPSQITFHVADTVNAEFTYLINYACDKDVASYQHTQAALNGVNSWLWTFTSGSPSTSSLPNPVITYTHFEPTTSTLIVSNGVCSDTTSQNISFDNYLKANFEVTPLVCPDTKASFINHTVGNIVEWKWTFGNGFGASVRDPLPQSYTPMVASDYNALPELIVKNDFGCYDTARQPVKVVYSCYITVPSAFTPNGDGLNDYLYPLKAYKSSNLTFSIYNRFGQRVFLGTDWQQKWDGKVNGVPQDTGAYVWILDYINLTTGKHVTQKGTSILIR